MLAGHLPADREVMTMGADPQTLLELAQQRGADLQAEVERHRLVRKLRIRKTWLRRRR
jgi:hypothetical protein